MVDVTVEVGLGLSSGEPIPWSCSWNEDVFRYSPRACVAASDAQGEGRFQWVRARVIHTTEEKDTQHLRT